MEQFWPGYFVKTNTSTPVLEELNKQHLNHDPNRATCRKEMKVGKKPSFSCKKNPPKDDFTKVLEHFCSDTEGKGFRQAENVSKKFLSSTKEDSNDTTCQGGLLNAGATTSLIRNSTISSECLSKELESKATMDSFRDELDKMKSYLCLSEDMMSPLSPLPPDSPSRDASLLNFPGKSASGSSENPGEISHEQVKFTKRNSKYPHLTNECPSVTCKESVLQNRKYDQPSESSFMEFNNSIDSGVCCDRSLEYSCLNNTHSEKSCMSFVDGTQINSDIPDGSVRLFGVRIVHDGETQSRSVYIDAENKVSVSFETLDNGTLYFYWPDTQCKDVKKCINNGPKCTISPGCSAVLNNVPLQALVKPTEVCKSPLADKPIICEDDGKELTLKASQQRIASGLVPQVPNKDIKSENGDCTDSLQVIPQKSNFDRHQPSSEQLVTIENGSAFDKINQYAVTEFHADVHVNNTVDMEQNEQDGNISTVVLNNMPLQTVVIPTEACVVDKPIICEDDGREPTLKTSQQRNAPGSVSQVPNKDVKSENGHCVDSLQVISQKSNFDHHQPSEEQLLAIENESAFDKINQCAFIGFHADVHVENTLDIEESVQDGNLSTFVLNNIPLQALAKVCESPLVDKPIVCEDDSKEPTLEANQQRNAPGSVSQDCIDSLQVIPQKSNFDHHQPSSEQLVTIENGSAFDKINPYAVTEFHADVHVENTVDMEESVQDGNVSAVLNNVPSQALMKPTDVCDSPLVDKPIVCEVDDKEPTLKANQQSNELLQVISEKSNFDHYQPLSEQLLAFENGSVFDEIKQSAVTEFHADIHVENTVDREENVQDGNLSAIVLNNVQLQALVKPTEVCESPLVDKPIVCEVDGKEPTLKANQQRNVSLQVISEESNFDHHQPSSEQLLAFENGSVFEKIKQSAVIEFHADIHVENTVDREENVQDGNVGTVVLNNMPLQALVKPTGVCESPLVDKPIVWEVDGKEPTLKAKRNESLQVISQKSNFDHHQPSSEQVLSSENRSAFHEIKQSAVTKFHADVHVENTVGMEENEQDRNVGTVVLNNVSLQTLVKPTELCESPLVDKLIICEDDSKDLTLKANQQRNAPRSVSQMPNKDIKSENGHCIESLQVISQRSKFGHHQPLSEQLVAIENGSAFDEIKQFVVPEFYGDVHVENTVDVEENVQDRNVGAVKAATYGTACNLLSDESRISGYDDQCNRIRESFPKSKNVMQSDKQHFVESLQEKQEHEQLKSLSRKSKKKSKTPPKENLGDNSLCTVSEKSYLYNLPQSSHSNAANANECPFEVTELTSALYNVKSVCGVQHKQSFQKNLNVSMVDVSSPKAESKIKDTFTPVKVNRDINSSFISVRSKVLHEHLKKKQKLDEENYKPSFETQQNFQRRNISSYQKESVAKNTISCISKIKNLNTYEDSYCQTEQFVDDKGATRLVDTNVDGLQKLKKKRKRDEDSFIQVCDEDNVTFLEKHVPFDPSLRKYFFLLSRGTLKCNAALKNCLKKLEEVNTVSRFTNFLVNRFMAVILNHVIVPNVEEAASTIVSHLLSSTEIPLKNAVDKSGNISLPVMPVSEQYIVQCLFHAKEKNKPHLKGLIPAVLSLVLGYFSWRPKPEIHGLAALCRLYTAIYQKLDFPPAPQLLCYDIILKYRKYASYLVASVVGVWPKVLVFQNVFKGLQNPLNLAMSFLLLHPPKVLHRVSAEYFKVIITLTDLNFQDVSPLNAVELVKKLFQDLTYCDESGSLTKGQVTQYTKAVELLCDRKGWNWANDVVVKQAIFPFLEAWISRHQVTNDVKKSAALTGAFHLLAYICHLTLGFNTEAVHHVMENMGTFLEDSAEKEIPFVIQEAAFTTLLDLKSTCVDVTIPSMRSWYQKNAGLISNAEELVMTSHIPPRNDDFSKYFAVDSCAYCSVSSWWNHYCVV